MTTPIAYHPLVKALLDGELRLENLPPELRAEGEEALALVALGDAPPPALSPWFEQKVMADIRRRPLPSERGVLHRLFRRREVRLEFRPGFWIIGAAALLAVVLLWPRSPDRALATGTAAAPTYVRFVLYAPNVNQVALAGSFNEWNASATPLVRVGTSGLWATTLAVPPGQHLYAFVVDGQQWVPDPAAPSVDDGFGRRNSVMTVPGQGGGTS